MIDYGKFDIVLLFCTEPEEKNNFKKSVFESREQRKQSQILR